MIKKIIINAVLLLTGLVSWLLLIKNDNATTSSQWFGAAILCLVSVILAYFNNKFRKEKEYRWFWVILEIINFLVICYAVFILFILFSLRNCCDVL